ncbi:hypothetical protein BDV59DRAFT_166330 [Aspergillus ambiguus]|uniref:uncharacterized protein n=1 Tax=Aspergillus ambiguus TaxID=176160 RepID=UPI003CCDC61F
MEFPFGSTPNSIPHPNNAQSNASRYGTEFLAAWDDSRSFSTLADTTNEQEERNTSMDRLTETRHYAPYQSVADRLTQSDNNTQSSRTSQAYQQLQQPITASQNEFYYHNRGIHCQGTLKDSHTINKGSHNQRPATEKLILAREMAAAPMTPMPIGAYAGHNNVGSGMQFHISGANNDTGMFLQNSHASMQHLYYHRRPDQSLAKGIDIPPMEPYDDKILTAYR